MSARCGCGAQLVNGHHCENGHMAYRTGPGTIEYLAAAPHLCRCCGEECVNGVDCCSDDFPEPGDIRETGR